MLHALLPTHARANKLDGGSRLCVLCGSDHEDHFHILCCEHQTRDTWRQGFLRDLRDFFVSSNTSPLLSNLLLESIRQWFLSPTDVFIQPERYHPLLRPIIHQQNQIGWSQLFMGRFAISWSRTQAQYFEHFRSVDDIKKHGTAWQASLIQFVWERWFTLWKQRNQEVHGHNERTRRDASQRETRRQLTEIYRHRHMYDDSVQQLLHQDIEDHMHQSLNVTKNWIATNANIFRDSYRRVKRRALSGMRSLRNYFGTR